MKISLSNGTINLFCSNSLPKAQSFISFTFLFAFACLFAFVVFLFIKGGRRWWNSFFSVLLAIYFC